MVPEASPSGSIPRCFEASGTYVKQNNTIDLESRLRMELRRIGCLELSSEEQINGSLSNRNDDELGEEIRCLVCTSCH